MIGIAKNLNQPRGALPLEGLAKFRQDLMSITLPGMKAFRDTLRDHLKSNIRMVSLDVGFNDPPYAETVLKLFDEITGSG